ncbi:MAG: GNAT family N-acetyltransferase [Alkalibacterium sp.]|nr:GNAT family N-acetyltransferase [Alkalibacterium sp.]
MKVISVREHPEICCQAIAYFQDIWATPESLRVYEDSISHSINTNSPLPYWYLLMDNERIAGCAGVITNDFISRMDLYPWLCALFIEPDYRGHLYSSLLIEEAKKDAASGGFSTLYLSTDHEGFYEKFGFEFVGTGYHPWGEESRIYQIKVG